MAVFQAWVVMGFYMMQLMGHICIMVFLALVLMGRIYIGHFCMMVFLALAMVGYMMKLMGHICMMVFLAWVSMGHMMMLMGHICMEVFLTLVVLMGWIILGFKDEP